jgi:hypothetical protein
MISGEISLHQRKELSLKERKIKAQSSKIKDAKNAKVVALSFEEGEG